MQTRPYYGLADLPLRDVEALHSLGRLAQNGTPAMHSDPMAALFGVSPMSLASIGTSQWPGVGQAAGGYPSTSTGEVGPKDDLFDDRIQTAFLQHGGVIADAVRSSPALRLKVSDDEIVPIRPGRPVRHRKPLDEKPVEKRVWAPIQIDLHRFDAPQGVPDRMTRLLNNPGLEDRMMEAIGAGRTMMGDAWWYDNDWLLDKFVKRRGEEVGSRDFRMLMDVVAATSPGSDVGTNIRNASYWFNRIRRGEPLPNTGHKNPYPYGHRLADLHLAIIRTLIGSGALDPILYPKITSYSENLKGNELPATIDIHALRLPAMLARAGEFLKREYREKLEAGKLSMDEAVKRPTYWRNPYPNEYAALEQLYKRLAERANLTPAEAQAAAWIGGGHITGVRSNSLWTFKQHFYDRLRRTAEKWGLSEDKVFDLFVDGKLDLVLGDGQSNPTA